MKLIPLLLIATLSGSNSALSDPAPTWTFESNGLTATLLDPEIQESPLRLSCAQRGYLEINILSGPSAAVRLVGPSKIALTIRGELSPEGHITSDVYFKSLAVEFLRQEGEVEVFGSRSYWLHLNGVRRVLETLESSCLAVS
jgi:hypothetical protein